MAFADVTKYSTEIMKAEKDLQELRKKLTEAVSVNERAIFNLYNTAREMIEESHIFHLLSSIDNEILNEKKN